MGRDLSRGDIHPLRWICQPRYFPRTVKRFWKLKAPPRRKQTEWHYKQGVLWLIRYTGHRLTYLLQFYQVQGYEEWGKDDDSYGEDSDSDESVVKIPFGFRIPITLELAVRSNPEIAHRALAAQLGLAYDEIEKFMLRAQMLAGAEGDERHKRQVEDQTSQDRRQRRFQRVSDGGATEVTSPTEPLSSQGKTR